MGRPNRRRRGALTRCAPVAQRRAPQLRSAPRLRRRQPRETCPTERQPLFIPRADPRHAAWLTELAPARPAAVDEAAATPQMLTESGRRVRAGHGKCRPNKSVTELGHAVWTPGTHAAHHDTLDRRLAVHGGESRYRGGVREPTGAKVSAQCRGVLTGLRGTAGARRGTPGVGLTTPVLILLGLRRPPRGRRHDATGATGRRKTPARISEAGVVSCIASAESGARVRAGLVGGGASGQTTPGTGRWRRWHPCPWQRGP